MVVCPLLGQRLGPSPYLQKARLDSNIPARQLDAGGSFTALQAFLNVAALQVACPSGCYKGFLLPKLSQGLLPPLELDITT